MPDSSWRHIFQAPVFKDDEEKNISARVLHTVLWVLISATTLAYLSLLVAAAPVRVIAITGLLLGEIISFVLLRRGHVRQAALFLCVFALIILVATLTLTGGVDGSSTPVLTLVVLIAGLILGGPAGVIFAAIATLAGLAMLVAELNGILPASMIETSPASYWIFVSLTFFSSAGLIYITTRSLKDTLARARLNEAAQISTNEELKAIRRSLEQQVAERTKTLEQRSRYLQAAIEVSRASASILDTDQLIQQIVALIQEQFDLYYVGLFLLDENGEWAVLKAGTGQAGRILLQRGHRIRVGSGMIGWCIANAASRVAQSAIDDTQRLATAELPDTRSEAAIPLRSRGKVLGAISVQSKRLFAFGEVEIVSFEAMADQVALAIDNSQLFTEAQNAVQEVQRAYGVASRLAWKELIQSARQQAFRYENGNVIAIDKSGVKQTEQQPESKLAKAQQDTPVKSLNVPIKVREQTIGHLSVQQPEGAALSNDLRELLQDLSDQLGIALESARLYQDSQRLALREQLTSELTSRIRQTLDMDTVLKTAAQEIQQTLGVSEVIIALQPATAALSAVEIEGSTE